MRAYMHPISHHLKKHRHVFGVSAFLMMAAGVALLTWTSPYGVFSMAITPANIIDLTNNARVHAGLVALKTNPALTRAAEAKAADMLKNQYFAHTSPSGVTPWSWITAQGYIYLYSGENLAVHYETAENVEESWLASQGHRANILNPRYSEIGVGVASGEFEGVPSIFVVQEFGAPAPSVNAALVAQREVPEKLSAGGTGRGEVLAASSVQKLYDFNKPDLAPVGYLFSLAGSAFGLVLILL